MTKYLLLWTADDKNKDPSHMYQRQVIHPMAALKIRFKNVTKCLNIKFWYNNITVSIENFEGLKFCGF